MSSAATKNLAPTSHHEEATVEELIRYAHARFAAAQMQVSNSKVTRLIRKVYGRSGADSARAAIDGHIARAAHDVGGDGWELEYADPTGTQAALNVDAENAAVDLMRRGHSLVEAARQAHLWEVSDAHSN